MTKGKETPTETQKDLAEKAMALKARAPEPTHPDSGRTADDGMTATPRAGIAPSGAFGAEGQRPVLERSRKVR
ncbi:hypothetical protein [uncultured Brevundimonas sp.]|uniref:hypothetical protein n=1 Tax=uncultured Brevundimonas sp. TaxID=213418 RepID=UPI0030EC2A14|tara:strand:- start:1643 stop:1861 length:219 start_codon:yes stop_codon:yes gene_type:complete